MFSSVLLAAANTAGKAALITFVLYLAGVFLLAVLANRIQSKREFAGEYFLGSKGLGMWAFALTAGATAASGGSFMGFPSLVYSHGWAVGWWISGYVLVPLVALGLVAKRMNQVGRLTGAITIPELMRRRFNSAAVGNLATFMIVFFTFFFLLAQFKAGAEIMAILFRGVPIYENIVGKIAAVTTGMPWIGSTSPDYLLCLFVFAAAVITYTTFGGFRAVVWTDVMQGIVMVLGVVILLILTLWQVGGLANATAKLTEMTPPEFGKAKLLLAERAPKDTLFHRGDWVADESGAPIRLDENVTIASDETQSQPIKILRITTDGDMKTAAKSILPRVTATDVITEEYKYGAGTRGVYVSAPGPSKSNPAGFMTVTLAISFFMFWNFGMTGQPSQLVRQMAFNNTATLRRSIVLVAVFYSVIYFPLVIIFTSARVLLPGMEIDADRIMPEMAAYVTEAAGVPWLAGLLVAAPFAAVMSSVDSFLLLVSSGIVRDFYQESINPEASESTIRKLSYRVTIFVGFLAVIAALNPPRFLIDVVVFASGGLAASFLAPIIFTLYWRRATPTGVATGMLTGAATILVLYLIGFFVKGEFGEYNLLGFHPFIWAILFSTFGIVYTSWRGAAPDAKLIEKYFGTPAPTEHQ